MGKHEDEYIRLYNNTLNVIKSHISTKVVKYIRVEIHINEIFIDEKNKTVMLKKVKKLAIDKHGNLDYTFSWKKSFKKSDKIIDELELFTKIADALEN